MDTMNVFPTDPVLAQQQADALQGNARKSLSEMSGAVTHAVWYFARQGHPPAAPDDGHRARKEAKKYYGFKFEGHRRAQTR